MLVDQGPSLQTEARGGYAAWSLQLPMYRLQDSSADNGIATLVLLSRAHMHLHVVYISLDPS
jgi:hypothetical protein